MGAPVFALCAVLAFAINWIAFVPAYFFQTERYFDLTGSMTYVSLVAVALTLGSQPDPRALLLGALALVWAVRLGAFLFARILRDASDRRFDSLKPSFGRFLLTWTLQGLWVLLTLSCALAAMTSARSEPLGGFAALGVAVWAAGFAVEVVADSQKRRFRADPANRDRFIQSGLWAWSRHPNYFGEITLWIGIALIALPALSGWQFTTLISPVFVYILLTRISGIPLLEARAKQRWGDDPDHRTYRERTPVLFLRPPRSV
jgi:steroid 5-alpha reductase family enzyme